MAKSKHTFAKRQREIEKKRKAEEKRAQRALRRSGGAPAANVESPAEGDPQVVSMDTENPAESDSQEATTGNKNPPEGDLPPP